MLPEQKYAKQKPNIKIFVLIGCGMREKKGKFVNVDLVTIMTILNKQMGRIFWWINTNIQKKAIDI